ncbi:MAG: endonuclease, partial [Prevotellaceae bacterium]|nr:endonuclease [Prevotellaceae bacterium]
MAAHNELGKHGEEVARQYLIDKGYKILETNW